MLGFFLIFVLLEFYGVYSASLEAVAVRNALYEVPGLGNRPLIIKMYPAIENYQSDLYEVYTEPYYYVSKDRKKNMVTFKV